MNPVKIYERPSGQRYWVVRAESGHYLPVFRHHGVVAIGHLDKITIPYNEEKAFFPDVEEVKKAMTSFYLQERKSQAVITSNFNQVKTFIYEMSVGDLVVSMDSHFVIVGRIVGHPRKSGSGLSVVTDAKTGRKLIMPSGLRRSVAWGSPIRRSEVTYSMSKSLRANQTVFNIDHHWESLYHTLYPAFTYKDKAHFSFKIMQNNNIDNYSVSQFLMLLSEIEAMTKDPELAFSSFDSAFNSYVEGDQRTISTKAQFMSEGDIWAVLNASPSQAVYFYFAYSALFGSDKVGWDGLIDLDTRHKIRDYIMSRIKSNHRKKMLANLELDKPERDNTPLEDNSNDEPPVV